MQNTNRDRQKRGKRTQGASRGLWWAELMEFKSKSLISPQCSSAPSQERSQDEANHRCRASEKIVFLSFPYLMSKQMKMKQPCRLSNLSFLKKPGFSVTDGSISSCCFTSLVNKKFCIVAAFLHSSTWEVEASCRDFTHLNLAAQQ